MVNKFNIPADSLVATSFFFSHLPPDLEYSRSWKQSFVGVDKEYPHCLRSLASATSVAQLESKLWIIDELKQLNISPNIVGLLGGWYSNFLTPLLLSNLGVSFVWNFEFDQDVKAISYKFNRKYKEEGKYECHSTDVMFEKIAKKEERFGAFDLIINTSCEHMFPMHRFRKINTSDSSDGHRYGSDAVFGGDPIYVLQSTDEDKYDDHINCVSSPEELAKQANITEILYSGIKVLDSGMKRFMVIGK